MGGSYLIRNMTRGEVSLTVDWAAKEGWNPGLYDAECFYKADPNGFFIGLLEGTPIAIVSAVAYDDTYVFGGFYIVKREFRGKGYGMKIFKKALEYTGDRNFGGDGVIENLGMYKKVGLELAHFNARYQGHGITMVKTNPNIVDLSKVPFDKLATYDDKVFGFKRRDFLRCWVNQPENIALGYIKNGKLEGYGVIRKCHKGYKIAPIFANNKRIAEKLFASLASSVEKNQKIFFDIPEVNKGAVEIINKFNRICYKKRQQIHPHR